MVSDGGDGREGLPSEGCEAIRQAFKGRYDDALRRRDGEWRFRRRVGTSLP
ncbi:hypothetical protein [Streptomyces sp. NPDC097610]|uniref:hypothetical protein n=1 Tax=Streptomyces sp. NPDC097610 TaxID=3157227 RepID=UPI00332E0192